MPRTRPPYPPEFRRQAIELVRSGTPIKQVAEELGVSEETLRNWVRQGDAARHPRREFQVIGPTALAHGVMRRAMRTALARVQTLAADLALLVSAHASAAAAVRTTRALEAVDGGGRQDAWL